ncbi:MAG: diguanylate cyclase [Nevskia sp.]|nr:diguanylate cyclase [Nevskia sp.]
MKGFSTQPDDRVVARVARVVRLALAASLTVAVVILALWFMPALAAWAPAGWSKMTANSALGMLLAWASLQLSAPQRSARQFHVGQLLAIMLLLLGTETLIEYSVGLDYGSDAWLPHDAAARHPGRVSPQTALGFVLLALSLLLIRAHKNAASMLADACTILLFALLLVLLGGYLFHAVQLEGRDASILSSPQTLLCFFLLTFAVAARRAIHGGIGSALLGVGIGSQIVRRSLPMILVLPFAFALLRVYLINSGTLPIPYARAFAAAGESLFMLGIVAWMAWRINELERDLRELSLTDELTGVHNRRGFYILAEQLQRESTRTDRGLTVFFFDLDGLKRTNDDYGHDAGSALICAFATILVATFRYSDVIGRLGGDEFAVAARAHEGGSPEVLERIAQRVERFNAGRPESAQLRFSVGYAERKPGDQARFEDVLARADAMMYQQKLDRKAARAA